MQVQTETLGAHTGIGADENTSPNTLKKDAACEVLGSGLVLIRHALSTDQQRWLAEYAIAAGSHRSWNQPNAGWYTADGNLNATPSRGRMYDRIDAYPDAERVAGVCQKAVEQARAAQPRLPAMDLTHMLLLLYKDAEGMSWHRAATRTTATTTTRS